MIKKKKSKPSSSNVLLTDDGRHIFHEGKLYSLYSDSASSDDGGVSSRKSERSKRSRGDSDNSQFDQDSESDDTAENSRHKSKSKRREEGKTDPSALRGLLYTLSRLMTVVPKTTTLSLTTLIPLKRHLE